MALSKSFSTTASGNTSPIGLFFKDDGSRFFVSDGSDYVYKYDIIP